MKPATSAKATKPAVKLCECGGERAMVYVPILGRWLQTKLCKVCECKENLLHRRITRISKTHSLRRQIKNAVPDLFQDAHISQIPGEVWARLKTKQPGQGIYLWGDVGRGKTYVAAAIMRNFIVRGRIAKRSPLKDIIGEIQATFNGRDSAETVYHQYIRADLLCIEDIGTGKNGGIESDFNQDVLLKLLDRRIEMRRTTIITSNLSPENIREAFGDRIFSRLQTFLIIKMTGKDRRESK